MAGYSPLKITGTTTGLVQERENFLLPDDAYPTLQNAYVFRERIKRKQGYQLLGRLQRDFETQTVGTSGASPWTFNLYSSLTPPFVPEPTSSIVLGSVEIYFAPITVTGNILTPGYTVASDCEVTTNTTAGLTTGDLLFISDVDIVPGSGPNLINGGPYTVEVIDATHFKLGVDSSTWGNWLSGGTWSSTSSSTITFTDQGNGVLSSTTPDNSGTINYQNGDVTLIYTASTGTAIDATFQYYPGLPVMGIRILELQNSANDQTVVFDQKYAYVFNSATNQFKEFITGKTWNAHNADVYGTDFFWSTNYWTSSTFLPGTATDFFTTSNIKLFWVTNNTGRFGTPDPIRITDGTTWIDFVPPNFGQIDSTNFLVQCLAFLPFRGRMLAFNTYEGPALEGALNYSNRIRWSTIGNPFIPFDAGPPAIGSWRDDIRGQGGFLDIPTSEDIITVGFVRDNLVIYCERSTWQLRYTGRSIAPFQIEKVNSELGAQSLFSAIQFDTSLVGIGDKGIVECDSYKSERIDIKIPDFVWKFQNKNNGVARVHGIRDFQNRLAYWTIPIASYNSIFPNQRLVYNYENDSWALFDDSLTAVGNYQAQSSRTWLNTNDPWIKCNFPWINQPALVAEIIGGNQQGFVEYLDELTTNDESLFISNIVGNAIAGPPITGTPTVVTSPNHNMQSGFVIGISGIPSGTPFDNLNDQVFGIIVLDINTFQLLKYNADTMSFSDPQLDVPTTDYIGGGVIDIRENFSIVSKKFNFLDEGQSIQLGYVDVLMPSIPYNQPGAISLNIYLDYNDIEVSNTLPKNQINNGNEPVIPDTFFNSVIPTTQANLSKIGGTKFWQRVYCATRANFLTLQYTFSNAQMAGEEQTKDVQIDAQVLWIRKAGRMTQI